MNFQYRLQLLNNHTATLYVQQHGGTTMNRLIKTTFFSLITGILLFSLPLLAGNHAEVGKPAPDFELKDLDGKAHKLSDYAGKFVVLEWTNPNCPFVVRHYKDNLINSLQKKYGEKGVVWLTINSTHPDHRDYETNESLKAKYTEWKASYAAQLVDLDGKVGKTYNAQTTPHMYIINPEGVLLYNGAIDDDPRGSNEDRLNYVNEALQKLMSGEAITTSTTRPYGCSVKYTKDT
jgi:peroxiredoxin